MKIVICLDYNPFTEGLLRSIREIVTEMKKVEITIIHIIDLTLFYGTSNFEEQLIDDLREDSQTLKGLCGQYLGKEFKYTEETGIPAIQIEETLKQSEYDLLIFGKHGKSALGQRLLGTLAQRLLQNSRKPVLIIPD